MCYLLRSGLPNHIELLSYDYIVHLGYLRCAVELPSGFSCTEISLSAIHVHFDELI